MWGAYNPKMLALCKPPPNQAPLTMLPTLKMKGINPALPSKRATVSKFVGFSDVIKAMEYPLGFYALV